MTENAEMCTMEHEMRKTVYFVSDQEPRSIQADSRHRQAYMARLQREFSEISSLYPFLPLEQELYSKLIYIHFSKTNIDVDNMSKPFVDAFKEIIYSDDALINHRVCSKIKFMDFFPREIRLDSFPGIVAAKLNDMIIKRSQHILYFEVGLFSSDMIVIGDKHED